MYYPHDLPAINYTTDALILLIWYVYKHVYLLVLDTNASINI